MENVQDVLRYQYNRHARKMGYSTARAEKRGVDPETDRCVQDAAIRMDEVLNIWCFLGFKDPLSDQKMVHFNEGFSRALAQIEQMEFQIAVMNTTADSLAAKWERRKAE